MIASSATSNASSRTTSLNARFGVFTSAKSRVERDGAIRPSRSARVFG
jgi:hypothetical protein